MLEMPVEQEYNKTDKMFCCTIFVKLPIIPACSQVIFSFHLEMDFEFYIEKTLKNY